MTSPLNKSTLLPRKKYSRINHNKIYTYNGNGHNTCRCCEIKIKVGGFYGNTCSAQCAKELLDYNAIPVNLLFIRRIFFFSKDEDKRLKEINKYIKAHELDSNMAKHKINLIGEKFLRNEIDLIDRNSKTIYSI